MTIDPRYLELMHAEIDGANSERDSDELKAFLARDPAAREQLDALRRLSETLDRVEPLDPPAELKAHILGSLPCAAAGKRVALTGPEQTIFLRLRQAWPGGRLAMAYGYAFAAGLIVAIAGYQLLPGHGTGGVGMNPSDLSGTMTLGGPERGSAPIRQVRVDFDGGNGVATIARTPAGFALKLDLDSRKPVDVALGYDAREVAFRGFTQDLEEVRGLNVAENGIRWTQNGRHRLEVFLAPRDARASTGAPSVELRCFVSGKLVHSSRIGPAEPG